MPLVAVWAWIFCPVAAEELALSIQHSSAHTLSSILRLEGRGDTYLYLFTSFLHFFLIPSSFCIDYPRLFSHFIIFCFISLSLSLYLFAQRLTWSVLFPFLPPNAAVTKLLNLSSVGEKSQYFCNLHSCSSEMRTHTYTHIHIHTRTPALAPLKRPQAAVKLYTHSELAIFRMFLVRVTG